MGGRTFPIRARWSATWPISQGAVMVIGLLFVLLARPGLCAGLHQQTFVLNPGWNAIYLEVEPNPADTESAFAGVPVASVWTWMPSGETVEFVQDPAEGLDNASGWLGYFPRPRPEAILTNLFALQANRAYLIKLDGTQPVTWTVSGRPSLRVMTWVADSFNLVGLPVGSSYPPTFGAYFADRPAHDGQPVYRLDAGGVWTLVEHPHSTPIQQGEAYWVYCDGTSDFDGPLEVSVDFGDTLDFTASLGDSLLIVRNRTEVDADITLTRLHSSSPVPLSLLVDDEETGLETWADLPQTYSIAAGSGRQLLLRLGVRRPELTSDQAESVLVVSNGLGARRLVTVEAQRVHPTQPPAKSASGGRGTRVFQAVGTPFAGLWRGDVFVESVSEAQMAGTTPVPTGKEFPLRYLIHVDSAGTVRLLKEVIEMWEEGTMAPDPEYPGFLTTEVPGRAVLLTDEDLIPNFEGVVVRDGIPVGLRFSSVAYDFPGESLEMNGVLGTSGTLEVTITMDSDLPTNPFLHSYHPDHNNLDEQFLNFSPEAYAVTRRVMFIFSDTDPSEKNSPDWGDSRLAGTYFEEITGVHRNTIYVGGTFRLQRFAAVPELNR